MHHLQFYKLIPGGNPTIIIHGSLPEGMPLATVAATLMQPDYIGAEQVGHLDLTTTPPHLTMMGNEFCINATRSAAIVLASQKKLHPFHHTSLHGYLTVSGMPHPVQVFVGLEQKELAHNIAKPVATEEPTTLATATTPLLATDSHSAFYTAMAMDITEDEFTVTAVEEGAHLMRMPGISHLLLNTAVHPIPEQSAEQATRAMREKYQLEKEPASGVVWYSANDINYAITPYVYVAATKSEYKETACGSASFAIGYLHYWLQNNQFCTQISTQKLPTIAVTQLSGKNITVTFVQKAVKAASTKEASSKGKLIHKTNAPAPKSSSAESASPTVAQVIIGGEVNIISKGTAYL